MKTIKRNTLLSALLVLALVMQMVFVPSGSPAKAAVPETFDPNFHIYIAFGQSNMEGNPAIEDEDLEIPDNYYMMQTADGHREREVGNWYDAVPPLANNNAKLSLVDHFGRNMVYLQQEDNPDIKIGLIVVAVAGSSIKGFDKDTAEEYYAGEASWMQGIANQYGGNPYERIIEMAKKAQELGVIKGIVMHQGETDGGDPTWPTKVKKVYDDMITDLGLGDNIPLLAGQVVGNNNGNIKKLPEQSENFYEITSEGFVGGGDNLHFSSAENREFGLRYAEKMLEVQPQYTFEDPTYTWSADNTSVTAKRVCKEYPQYVQEETVAATKTITKEAAIGVEGSATYTSADFKNAAFTKQTKTETIPALVDTTPVQTPAPTPSLDSTQTQTEKVLKLSAVKVKKNTKKITGKVSEKGATVKIKVGKKAAKKATVKGKNFTLKLSSKLKKKTKVKITVTKKNFKKLTKTYTVK